MKIKTVDLTGAALDWAVAEALGETTSRIVGGRCYASVPWWRLFQPSFNWAQGGPLIDLKRISIHDEGTHWWAHRINQAGNRGPTALVAAMRCIVIGAYGDEIETPDELGE